MPLFPFCSFGIAVKLSFCAASRCQLSGTSCVPGKINKAIGFASARCNAGNFKKAHQRRNIFAFYANIRFRAYAFCFEVFRPQLADQFKIDVYDVVRQGKFTFDWVYQTGQLAQSDLNGDTNIDTADDRFGFIVESLNLIHMISAAGEKLARTNQKGEPELSINSKVVDIAQRYVEVINDTDAVISVQDYRIKSGGPASVFNPGRAFFWITNLQRMNAARSFEVDFGMVPFPKWEESDEYIAPMNGYWDSWLMVPATNDELDRTGNIVEALGYYSKELVTPAFIETSVTTKALRDDESAEMLQMVLPKMSFDAGLYFDWGYSQFIQIATKHTSDVVSLIDSERPAIEASIADFIKAFK